MKWFLGHLSDLRRVYEFEFRHVQVDYRKLYRDAEDVVAALEVRLGNDNGAGAVATPQRSPTVTSPNRAAPAPAPSLVTCVAELLATSVNADCRTGRTAAASADRSWEDSVPRVLRERARSLAAQSDSMRGRLACLDPAVGAYENSCVTNDRDILNFLGCVLAVDFRHWGSGTYGDDVAKVEGCWCVTRAFPLLPCRCSAAGKRVYEKDVRQVYGHDHSRPGERTVVRGSMAMVCRMRDAVDLAAEDDPNRFWFRPAALVRRTIDDADGRFELVEQLFSGFADPEARVPLLFPAAMKRVEILKEVAMFFKTTGKDFYDLVVEADRTLVVASETPTAAAAATDAHATEFTALSGLLPALCRHMPRFLDAAIFARHSRHDPSHDGAPSSQPKFAALHALTSPPEGSATRFIVETNPVLREYAHEPLDEVAVLFLKLAQLFATATRSSRGLFTSGPLRWLRDDMPFHDEAEHMTIASDYQIPNALRFAGLITYSEELSTDIDSRLLLPPLCQKEVEIRLVSIIAATTLRAAVLDAVRARAAALRSLPSADAGMNSNPSETATQLEQAAATFTTSLLDFAVWLFGRTLTSTKLGRPHHLTPGIMY